MLKKGLASIVILLFVGIAFAQGINANVSKSSLVSVNYIEISEEDDATQIELGYQMIRDLVQSIDLRKIIVNHDGVVETLEEISSILEEEDVRNYIEKTSNRDCGCEDELSLEWKFPAICTLLYPLLVVSAVIFLAFHIRPFYIFMENLGSALNCFWASPEC